MPSYLRPDFNALKQSIDLVQLALSMGYEIDRRKTTRRSISLKLAASDKIVVSKKNGHWVYFSVYDDRDKGSVFDFLLNRTGKSLREIAGLLEECREAFHVQEGRPELPAIEEHVDPKRIARIFNSCSPVKSLPYLTKRGIGEEILNSSRFTGCVYTDRYGNAVFPHLHKGRISALELKSPDLSVMVRGSLKSIWSSNQLEGDNSCIIAEAPIDAMSHYKLFSLPNAFYLATGGGLSRLQGEIIVDALQSKPSLNTVICISDNDKGGDRLSDKLQGVIQGHTALKFMRHSPEIRGKDWNEFLIG